MWEHAVGCRQVARLLLVCAGLWLPGSAAQASFIAMDTQTEVALRDGQVVLRVTTTNRGDEPAFHVRLEALHPEDPKSSANFERLDIGASAEHTFQWEASGGRYRQRVIPVLTHYTDANYYALSALTQTVLAFGEHPVTTLAARIDPVEANPRGLLRVRLRSIDDAPHSVGLRVVTPVEIGVQPRSAEAEVPASGEVLTEFELENFSGLPGSVYGVTMILSEERADGIVETVVPGSVKLLEPLPPRTARVWIVAPVVMAMLVLVGWQLGAFRRLRRG